MAQHEIHILLDIIVYNKSQRNIKTNRLTGVNLRAQNIRYFSTVRELPIKEVLVKDIISFEYEDHGDYLDRKLKEILLPYYNMDNSISEVTITFETFDGNLTLHLHSGILSKSTASSLDTYLYDTAECMHSDIAD
jgi:hypothetical protein